MSWWASVMLFQAYAWLSFAVLDLALGAPVDAALDLGVSALVRLVAYQFAREKQRTP
jgi:hypothetical protein